MKAEAFDQSNAFSSDPDKTTFGIFNCEQLLRDVWEGYFGVAIEARCAAAGIEDRLRGRLGRIPRLFAVAVVDAEHHPWNGSGVAPKFSITNAIGSRFG